MPNSGQIDRLRKRLHNPGTLPPVVLADVTGRDADGELLARPTEWDEAAHGAPPVIRIVMPRRPRPGEVAGVGDRALLRIEKSSEDETTARVIKLLDRAKHRVLGIFRGLPGGGGRLVPVDKKQLGREMAIPADRAAAPSMAIWSRSRWRAMADSVCQWARSLNDWARSRASAPSA